tara:strand:+ start:203 stop:412 length:210 start_codon:yes stop_codon:yes gene_type:complete
LGFFLVLRFGVEIGVANFFFVVDFLVEGGAGIGVAGIFFVEDLLVEQGVGGSTIMVSGFFDFFPARRAL